MMGVNHGAFVALMAHLEGTRHKKALRVYLCSTNHYRTVNKLGSFTAKASDD